jgi:hypothetical protein
LLAWLVGAYLILHSPAASADVRIELDRVLNGSAPGSSTPWLIATFTTLFPGTVELTLEARLDFPTEFISDIALNLNPAMNPADLLLSSSGTPAYQRVNTSSGGNSLNLGGAGASGGGCDILIEWPAGGGSQNRFDGTDSVTLSITGPQDLVAEDFFYYNTVNGTDGPLIVGAHIQGIPTGGSQTTSGAIIQTIPEPGTGVFFGVMIMWFYSRKRM